MVLEDVTELWVMVVWMCEAYRGAKPVFCSLYSDTTPEGRKKTKLAQTLLNGNNICMVRRPLASLHWPIANATSCLCF